MKTDLNPFDAFNSSDKKSLEVVKTFTDALINMKGELLEFYLGDQSESVDLDQFSTPYNCCIFGKLIDVLDRVIVVECLYVDKATGTLTTGNKVFINTFQIRALTKLDGKGSLQDIFLNSRDAHNIRKLLHKMHGKLETK